MNFRLSRHAQEEMVRRGIPEHMVDDVLANPQQVIDMPDRKKTYQSQLNFGSGRFFLLRVIVAVDVDPYFVVTV